MAIFTLTCALLEEMRKKKEKRRIALRHSPLESAETTGNSASWPGMTVRGIFFRRPNAPSRHGGRVSAASPFAWAYTPAEQPAVLMHAAPLFRSGCPNIFIILRPPVLSILEREGDCFFPGLLLVILLTLNCD